MFVGFDSMLSHQRSSGERIPSLEWWRDKKIHNKDGGLIPRIGVVGDPEGGVIPYFRTCSVEFCNPILD